MKDSRLKPLNRHSKGLGRHSCSALN